jgi:outer membrane receptor protein involved in Fe transport
LRGTYSQGFRAPSILELYQGARNTNFQAVDPCNGGGAGLPGCSGVPASYNQNQFGSGAIAGVTIGNSNLEAETADTYSIGAAYTPGFLPGLSLTVDWFQITVKDAIAAQTAAQILQACANRTVFCDLIDRAPTGEILELRQAVVNLSSIEVSGVDASARYLTNLGAGKLEASVDASYLDRYRTSIPQPDGSIVVDDRAGLSNQPRSTFPHWKGQAALRWIGDELSAGWKARFIGPSDDIPGNAVNGGRIKSITYHDLQATAKVADRFSFTLGVDNVFDTQPPASAANNPINFDIYTYDIRGRYYYARIGADF